MPADPGSAKPLARAAASPAELRVSIWWRVAAVALGLAGLGSGAVAVFITHLEAGPVALLAVGLVLLIIGISGRLPNYLKWGDKEAAWQDQVGSIVQGIAEDAGPSAQPQLAKQLNDLAQVAPRAAAPALSALAFEEMAIGLLQASVAQLPPGFKLDREQSVTTFDDGTITHRVIADAVISSPANLKIAVEIKLSASAARSRLQAFSLLGARYGDNEIDGVLLITRDPLGSIRNSFDDRNGAIVYIAITGLEDIQRLAAAIVQVVNLAEEVRHRQATKGL